MVWEIFRRGRRLAWLGLACISFCAAVNLIIRDTNHELFSFLFGFLMVLSFLLLLGIFNCTETSSSKDWSGFPYRMFTLPLPTWKLVILPMLAGLIVVELLYFGWVKLVWTHNQVVRPEWYAVILGAYVLYYQTILWSLAGFRLLRTIVLSVGGVSGFLVAILPVFGNIAGFSPWFSEKRLMPLVIGSMPVTIAIAWSAVKQQRHGGGRRRSWLKALVEFLTDILPRRSKQFASPAAAQFWFEWRRSGLLLTASVVFALLVMVAPLSWQLRANKDFTMDALCWVIGLPLALGFLIGKGFIKPDSLSTNLSVPSFLAVRPLPAVEFVFTKLKVAALSVAITWILVVAFAALWLFGWAETSELSEVIYQLKIFYPHSWHAIIALSVVAFMVLTWRFMVSGLWSGLSGSKLIYFGSIATQVIVPLLALLICAIWSKEIDQWCQRHQQLGEAGAVEVLGWILAALVIGKVWIAMFSWRNVELRRARYYLLLWCGSTLCATGLAVLCHPPLDTFRTARLYVLGALLLMPIARIGIAPQSFNANRHRR